MAIAYVVIHKQYPPRIFPDCQNALQLGQQFKFGDWYFFGDYIVITIYGFESHPYILPIFLTHIFFQLELIRKTLSFDCLHFFSKAKNTVNF